MKVRYPKEISGHCAAGVKKWGKGDQMWVAQEGPRRPRDSKPVTLGREREDSLSLSDPMTQ